MTFELGVHSFGNTPRTADGDYGATAQAIRHVLEAVHVAEEVGLDFFGFGRQGRLGHEPGRHRHLPREPAHRRHLPAGLARHQQLN
jgi:hypothetical protein